MTGSTDNSLEICNDYSKKDNRIKVIHKSNGGVSSARNYGINIAKGEWLSFVDADDWIEKEYIENLLFNIKKYNADIALCSYYRVVSNNKQLINISIGNEVVDSKQYLIKALNPQTGYGFCHMKLYKKSTIGKIRFDESLKVGEDALFNIQVSSNIKEAISLNKPMYNYRINNQSVVKKYDKNYANKYLKSMQIIQEYIWNKYNKENEKHTEIKQNFYNFVAYHIMLITVNYCYNPDNKICNSKRKKMLKEVLNNDMFMIGLKKSNYNNISLTRKITLYTLKHKLYWLTANICKIRQRQNRKKEV